MVDIPDIVRELPTMTGRPFPECMADLAETTPRSLRAGISSGSTQLIPVRCA